MISQELTAQLRDENVVTSDTRPAPTAYGTTSRKRDREDEGSSANKVAKALSRIIERGTQNSINRLIEAKETKTKK